jgi:hypothetical protein
MKKIKEIVEFAKMFKLNIPIEKYFEYYIQTLFKSFEFKDIISLVDNYSEFEEWLQKSGYNNVGHYKMGTVYGLLKNHLESSESYKRCQEFDYSKTKLFTKDYLKLYEGNFMLSLDFSSANFQSMKIFDTENELKSSWVELCDSFKIHPMISSSKSFRQVVFGNLNPKRFQKIQHYHMLKLVEELEEIFPSENIIFISHDELVMNLGDNKEIAHERIEQIIEVVKTIKEKRLSDSKTWMNVNPTIFKLQKISKDIYVKTIFSQTMVGLVNGYKTLFGCPGNKYYINFKEYILEEDIEERDCLFMLDNNMAKWVL